MLVRLEQTLIDTVLSRARQSPRLRSNHNFHQPGENLQRMLNVALRDSYFRTHKHENPDKLEVFTALKGRAAVVLFHDDGEVKDVAWLREEGPVFQAEIPPRQWHTIVVLSEAAALYEIIEGAYDPQTHKQFAPFAPAEGSAEAEIYLRGLRERLARDFGIRDLD